jgi:flagellar motor switch protein FliG
MPEKVTVKMTGLRKAAILLVSIDQDSAGKILAQLDRETMERVLLEIAKLESEPPSREERDEVLKEFHNITLAHQYIEEGGIAYAKQLLERIMPPEDARKLIEMIEVSMKTTPFGFLGKADIENLVTFIQDEHPQTIALIMAYLAPSQSASILEALPIKKQQEVIKRLAVMEHTSPEVVEQIEKALETKLATYITELRKTGGVKAAAEILNLVQRSTEKAVLETLEEDDPEMVQEIRKLMFTFDDIIRVNDRGMQNLLQHIDKSQLALALKTASPEVKEKFFKNMSKRAVEDMRETMEYMGPVRLADVEASQQAIVEVVRRLEEEGQVIIEGRGGAEEIIV